MSCYGCDGTGVIKQKSFAGKPCFCRLCSECGEFATQPLETTDIKDNGSGYQACAACETATEETS